MSCLGSPRSQGVEILDVVFAGKIMGMAKTDDGTRVLAYGLVIRRLVAIAGRAFFATMSLTQAASAHQFGVWLEDMRNAMSPKLA